MASMWRRAMVYLGLVDDEEYEEYDPYPQEPAPAQRNARRPAPMQPERGFEPEQPMSGVRTLPARDPEPTISSIQPQPSGGGGGGGGVVRRLQPVQHQKVHVVAPDGFNDAKEIGDRLKANQPVILNLQAVDRDLCRRLIDFASGLTYGLAGSMERVAEAVFLLTPSNVEVSAEERRRLQERGLYRS